VPKIHTSGLATYKRRRSPFDKVNMVRNIIILGKGAIDEDTINKDAASTGSITKGPI